jgi:hypothetical protein
MKLTKTKLNQLIRESLADYDGYGSPSDDDLEYLNTLPPKASKKDFLASLSKEQKELAEDTLGWWAKQIDETGRLSGHTGKDGSIQSRVWSDEMLTNPPPGAEPVGLYICKLVLEALKGWVHWGDDDRLLPEIKILIEKFNAILAGDDAPEEREPEQAKRCLNDTDCTEDETCYKGQCQPQRTHGRFGNLEFDEALQLYKEGQSMKLTPTILKKIIREEAELTLKEELVDTPEFSDVDKADLPDLEALDQEMEQVLNDMDRARIARDYATMGELFARLDRLGLEIAKLQGLMNPE